MIRTTEYFTPRPPTDVLMPPIPPIIVSAPIDESFLGYWDETVYKLAALISIFIKDNFDAQRYDPRGVELVPDRAQYFAQQKRWAPEYKSPRCYIPQIHEIELTKVCLVDTERTPCDVVPFGYRNELGELLSPPTPQPPPPVQDFHAYTLGLQGGFPSVRFKSSAKTEEGIKRFKEKAECAWQERRALFAVYSNVLSKLGLWERRDWCPRCGSSFFKRKGVKLLCYDCGKKQFEPYEWETRSAAQNLAKEQNAIQNLADGEMEVPSRKTHRGGDLKPKWIAHIRQNMFIQDGEERTLENETRVRNHPRFEEFLALFTAKFEGGKVKDMAAALGISQDAASKRRKRSRDYHPLELLLSRGNKSGSYFCVTQVNGRFALVLLAPASASWEVAMSAFQTKRGKAVADAVRKAKQRTVGKSVKTIKNSTATVRRKIARGWAVPVFRCQFRDAGR